MKSDIEIARECELKKIKEVARSVGIPAEEVSNYGRYIAKVPAHLIDGRRVEQSNLILVTAITPTKAGIGKTTVSIGLALGLNRIGKKAIVALREPSLGPCFGMKGGAAGGGYAQVLPMDSINLHFTGDFHAITSAHNMIMALLENYIYQHQADGFGLKEVLWKRVMDVNDRSLRNIVTGLGGRTNGIPRESGFDITPASEIMAILCLATDIDDLRRRIDNILLGYTYDDRPFTVRDLGVTGAIVVLLKDALNPNLGAVFLVSLGCESVPSQKVLEAVRAAGKPAEMIVIQQEGGLTAAVEKGRKIVKDLVDKIKADPVAVSVSKLRVGLKCGSSDTTQGLSANVVVGSLTDVLASAGAGVVIGETTEFMGAEHIAARNAADKETAESIVRLVRRMEERALAVGVDMRGGQPTRGNIAGGLSTIEEKSLGALAKAGSAVYQKVIDYGDRTDVRGLVMMDAPGREPEMLTGLAAAGCNLIVFSTGRGAPQGFPFVPVVKITGNERTYRVMNEHMDMCVSGVMSGTQSVADAARELLEEVLAVASGKPSKAERCGYNNSMNIYVTGPVI